MLSQGYSNAHCLKITTGLLSRVQVSKDTSMVALSVQTCKSSLPRFVKGATSADVNCYRNTTNCCPTTRGRFSPPIFGHGEQPRSSARHSRLCSCHATKEISTFTGLMAIISMVLRRFEVVFTAGTVASGTGTKRVRGHEDIARLHT
jgi:hypothetical protein